jgi:hypothetical protein
MIWLGNEPPVIDLGAAGSVALDQGWLEQCLEEAASAAGYEEWPAADVARSVAEFFLAERSENPYSLEVFTSKVHWVLRGIGYGEVAPFFLRDGLELRVSLLDLAEEHPSGFELGFFKSCERACNQLLTGGLASKIAFEEMQPAVKAILQRAHWCRRCDVFAGDLVAFLRVLLQKLADGRRITFAIR